MGCLNELSAAEKYIANTDLKLSDISGPNKIAVSFAVLLIEEAYKVACKQNSDICNEIKLFPYGDIGDGFMITFFVYGCAHLFDIYKKIMEECYGSWIVNAIRNDLCIYGIKRKNYTGTWTQFEGEVWSNIKRIHPDWNINDNVLYVN